MPDRLLYRDRRLSPLTARATRARRQRARRHRARPHRVLCGRRRPAGRQAAARDEGGRMPASPPTVYDDQHKTEIVHVPAEGAARGRRRRDRHARYSTGTRATAHAHAHGAASAVRHAALSGHRRRGRARTTAGSISTSRTPASTRTSSPRTQRADRGRHPVTERWITDAELEANPGLVSTMSVKPPMGTGRVRLLIGENGASTCSPAAARMCDRTGEIGPVVVTKIEKKGKQNRRIRVARSPEIGGTSDSMRRIASPLARRPHWLAEHLNAPDLVVLDGSLHLPTAKRDAKAEFLPAHIPGALFFDIDDDRRTRTSRCPTCCLRRPSSPAA